MDNQGDAVNLADVDVVKNTQFSQGDFNDSQIQAGTEHFVYGHSQQPQYNPPKSRGNPSTFPATPQYVPFQAMQASQGPHMQDNQRLIRPSQEYEQHQIWSNYAPGYGQAVHAVQTTFSPRIIAPYSNGNFASPSNSYGAPTHFRHTEGVHHHQVLQQAHGVRARDGITMRNMNMPTHELFQGQVFPVVPYGNPEVQCLSSRASPNFAKTKQYEQSKEQEPAKSHHNAGGHPQSNYGSAMLSEEGRNVGDGRIVYAPLEVQQSPTPNSPDSYQGPLPSDSVEPVKGDSKCEGPRRNTNPAIPMQGFKDSSKSKTLYSLSKRRALREEEKSYMKQVTIALREGKVPRVKVEQDDNGDIVRYKPQFMNALKLAAHTIVQEAYIDVNKQGTMHEIMEEVGRQFSLSLPLPKGMVEGFLLRYFKRNRSKYHKFWMNNGDAKRLDDCKPTAWLQLIEYWNSLKGKKDCNQNKANASAQLLHEGKKIEDRCFEASEDEENTLLYLPTHRSRKGNSMRTSGSLGFEDAIRGTTGTPSPSIATSRHSMVDITNQLHDAVDNIFFSFAAKYGALTSMSTELQTSFPLAAQHNLQTSRNLKGVGQTTSEVMCSLRRPRVGEDPILFPRMPHPDLQRQRISKEQTQEYGNSNHDGERIQKNTLDTKGCNSSFSARGKGGVYVGTSNGKEILKTQRTLQHNSPVMKEEHVLLSSDPSSEGAYVRRADKTPENAGKEGHLSSHFPGTEEIERPQSLPTDSWNALNRRSKICGDENAKSKRNYVTYMGHRSNMKQKLLFEEEEMHEGDGTEHCDVGRTSRYIEIRSKKRDEIISSNAETCSEDEAGEEGEYESHVDFDEDNNEEEPPVLPRTIVKRKMNSQCGGNIGQIQSKTKGKKATKTQIRRQKATPMDSNIITKLEFFKRAKNSSPIKPRVKVWVLHPKYVGKVVAEAYAGVNSKSRCTNGANKACKEGQQMISVIRVFYQDTPVMYDSHKRFPKHIQFLEQGDQLPNTPILWCVAHLIEILQLEQITRLLGECTPPSSQKLLNSDSDFQDTRPTKKPNSQPTNAINKGKGSKTHETEAIMSASKETQCVKNKRKGKSIA